MPTWKEMFIARRVPVALCVATLLICSSGVAGAATTTTIAAPPTTAAPVTSAPPQTAPPHTAPPAAPDTFALPTDYGLQLVETQNAAKRDLKAAQAELAPAKKQAAAAKKSNAKVQKRLAKMKTEAKQNAMLLDRSRQNLRKAAARAYIHAGGGQLAAAISSLTNASSAVDVASQLHLISMYSTNEKDALEEYLALKDKIDRQILEINELRATTEAKLKDAVRHVADVKRTIEDSARKIAETVAGFEKFTEAATSASSPILGPSRLSANQLAAFIEQNGYKPRITVPILDLAQYYLDEGARTGVRGDVAFAQSILETGGFRNPGSRATDNNFAGIGWCDSCAHGYNFPTAQLGVRAQLQLLRIYVDPAFPGPDYTDEILLKGTLKLGFRGRVQTWWDLWGTWATAALYGQRVYDLYERIVEFSKSVPPLPRVAPGQAPDSGAEINRPDGTGPGTKGG